MRRLVGPFLMASIAFASYSVKSNQNTGSSVGRSAKSAPSAHSSDSRTNASKLSRDAPDTRPCDEDEGNALQCAADKFYGVHTGKSAEFRLSTEEAAKVRFVIATVPDPVHTDLAMQFDRFVEAIQQGAQESGYTFDRAVLPWRVPGEFSQQAEESEDKEGAVRLLRLHLERENSPGLLIFRNHEASHDSKNKEKQLFVLLVGETPISGLNKEQFNRALSIIRNPRGGSTGPWPRRVDILGPTFSGSLYSLGVLSDQISAQAKRAKSNPPMFRIRSGTLMSARTIYDFERKHGKDDFLAFKDTDESLINSFIKFSGDGGYDPSDIALLSEDETAFGALSNENALSEPSSVDNSSLLCGKHSKLLCVYFPRGVSQLRRAYQDDPALSSRNEDVPHSRLRLNLNSTGRDDDTVPVYAPTQTALSQEAVMMGIVTVLRVHSPKFLILRATDPYDLLFLTRFFRTNYPQDRIVTMGADQLFPRDMNDTVFRGVLSLTNYPLLPRQLTDFQEPRAHRVFASTECAGLFNATLAILKEGEKNGGPTLPEARYFEYSSPIFAGLNEFEFRPAMWLTVMGDDGYWPLTVLPRLKPNLGLPPAIRNPRREFLPSPISLRPSPFNELLITVLLASAVGFCFLTWLGDFKYRSSPHQQFAMLTDRPRARLIGAVSLIIVTALVLLASPFSGALGWPLAVIFGIAAIIVSTFLNLRARGQSGAALVYAFASAVLCLPLCWLTRSPSSVQEAVLFYRMAWVQSGVAPNLPVLLICGALLVWAWFNLKARSLFDYRRPWLPRGIAALPRDDEHNSEEYTQVLVRSPVFVGMVALIIAIVVIRDIDPLSLDGVVWRTREVQFFDHHFSLAFPFDDVYRIFFLLCLLLIANSMFNAWRSWNKCRVLLLHLDRTPLRWVFRQIQGFSWKPLWGLAGGDLVGAYKPLSRSLEALTHLQVSLRTDRETEQLSYLRTRAELVDNDIKELHGAFACPVTLSHPSRFRQNHDNVVYGMYALQKNLAVMCSLVWLAVLEKVWRDDTRSVTSAPRDLSNSSESENTSLTTLSGSDNSESSNKTPGTKENQSVRLAEEFIALIYINFVHRALLRVRWLILAGSSAFVLLLFSAKMYPFEPKSSVDGLFILLFLGIAGVASAIYAQMHRDATLSHLTNTKPGELGSDFWIRIVGFGAVPVLSLVATQVPTLNRAFYVWLKPILDALHGG